MNPFITISQLRESTDSILIYCRSEESKVVFSIPGSVLFIVPNSPQALVDKIQKLSLEDSKNIICYDKGDLIPAGKTYWGLKAAGFENLYLLLGGYSLYNDLGHEVTTDIPQEIALVEYSYLPFNNSILEVFEENPKKKSSLYQLLKAEEDLPVTTPRGELLPKEILKEVLDSNRIEYKSGKPIQIYGKYCMILACILLYLGENHVSVLLDNKEQVYLTGNNRSVDDVEPFLKDSARAYSVHENTHYDSTLSPVEPKRESTRKAGTVCGNCITF